MPTAPARLVTTWTLHLPEPATASFSLSGGKVLVEGGTATARDARPADPAAAAPIPIVHAGMATARVSGIVRMWPRIPNDAVALACIDETAVSYDPATGHVRFEIPDHPEARRPPQVVISATVPVSTSLIIDANTAETVITGTVAGVSVMSSTGSIHVDRVTGHADLSTASGGITVHEIQGSASVQCTSGVVVIRSAGGPMDIRTGAADIDVWYTASSIAANSVTGRVKLGLDPDPPFRLTVESVAGSIRLRDLEWDVDARRIVRCATTSGDVLLSAARPVTGPRAARLGGGAGAPARATEPDAATAGGGRFRLRRSR